MSTLSSSNSLVTHSIQSRDGDGGKVDDLSCGVKTREGVLGLATSILVHDHLPRHSFTLSSSFKERVEP